MINNLFLFNKYTTYYFNIIKRAINRRKQSDCFYENHHIIPKSLGGSNKSNNLVYLTTREHFLAHRLLVKMTSGPAKKKMTSAIFSMTFKSKSHMRDDIKIGSRLYEKIRNDYIKYKKESSIHFSNIRNMILDPNYTNRPMEGESFYHPYRRLLRKDDEILALVRKHKPDWLIERKKTGRKKDFSKDLTGKKFGELTVIGRNQDKHQFWDVLCSCGVCTKVSNGNLLRGQKSCGHIIADHLVKLNKDKMMKKYDALVKMAHLLLNNEPIPDEIDGFTIKQLNNTRKGRYLPKHLKINLHNIYKKWKSKKIKLD